MSVLLFVLCFNGILEIHEDLKLVAFVDDLAFVSPGVEEAIASIESIRYTASRLNLDLNMGKTKIITADPRASAMLAEWEPMDTLTAESAGIHLGHPITVPENPALASSMVADMVFH